MLATVEASTEMDLQQTGHPFVLVSTVRRAQPEPMRLRRTTRPALELSSSDHPMAVWDGLTNVAGPSAVIRAARADELVRVAEVQRVA